jgi:hypothetical protein
MEYITGMHALNTNCDLDTAGDWHYSSLDWSHPKTMDSTESVFGNYGLERKREGGNLPVANHIRALLDMLAEGNFSDSRGMRDDFISNDEYTGEIFDKVFLLRKNELWNEIDAFMRKEYMLEWVNYLEEKNVS